MRRFYQLLLSDDDCVKVSYLIRMIIYLFSFFRFP